MKVNKILINFSLENDVILVHRKLGRKLITLQDFINLYNNAIVFRPIWQKTEIDFIVWTICRSSSL